jgi:predicted enzyme related to lactoylglutathione lyase
MPRVNMSDNFLKSIFPESPFAPLSFADFHQHHALCRDISRRRRQSMRGRNPLVIHYVYDMNRAKRFYTEVFQVRPNFESPGWTTLDFGSIELALHITQPNSEEPELPLPHAGLNLEVDKIEDVQADIERLGGQLTDLREPDDFVPVRVASFRDCEGNGFELRQFP